ncbi:hypothetical protein [Hahella ganghwensis]|uniref:hypothetical protein n=1 Tax=Hahella ganghwensis TaxID=286420 RepID=UPI00035CAA17|nr:hypothetical protein [Hahella ganghwensis]
MVGVSRVLIPGFLTGIVLFSMATHASDNSDTSSVHKGQTQPSGEHSDEHPISQKSPASIHIDGDTLYYSGNISEVSWDSFQAVTAGLQPGSLTRLVINSSGGDTVYGRKMGRWVKDNITILEVQGGCFSSCANYIFPAAKIKRIQESAFVGWHGSESQFDVLAMSAPDKTGEDILQEEVRQAMLMAMPELEGNPTLDEEVARELARSRQSQKDEHKFFEELGINSQFTIYGLLPEHLSAFEASGKRGWGFTIEDMKKLGLGEVQYLSDSVYHQSIYFQRYLQLIPVK